MAKKFYAVRQGRVRGVYTTWSDCEKQVKGYGGAIYKSFSTEAEARAFVEDSGLSLSDFMSAKKSELKSPQEVKFKSKNSRPIVSSSSIQSKVSANVVKPDLLLQTIWLRISMVVIIKRPILLGQVGLSF